MKKIHVCILAVLLIAALQSHAATIFPGLMGKQLVDSLRKYYKPTRTLSDAGCRDTVYGEIDIMGDSLECVYSGLVIHGGPTSDPSTWANNNDINPEHTWPESLLDSTKATQDMQHLFPTEMQVNSYRSSLPFGECADNLTTTWSRNNIHQSAIPGANIDEWSETISNTLFEPREIQKGKTARAMYYMLTMWQIKDTTLAWWTGQKDTLYKWHCLHPATAAESIRTYKVAPHQSGKINPFIIDSTLIRRAYFPSIPTNTQVNFSAAAITKNEGDGTFNLTVNISSPSGSSATTVQVVLTGGTGTAADVNNYTTQTLTFPAGSSAQQSAAITITDDALNEGTETVVFKLRNVSGGSSAAIGADSAFTLTIIDNDAPMNTTVNFNPVSISKTEGDAPFNITVAIANPSGTAATTANVVLASGSGTAADINNYSTQTVTFPAGSSTAQNVAITITDDALVEGAETLVFKLRNVSGGSSAAPGADSAFTLTLADNDGGTVSLFTETMGTVAGTTTIAAHEAANGFDNDPLTMSGTADIRNTTPSTGYPGASGAANVFITNIVGRSFLISDINASAKAALILSFGIYKNTTTGNGSDLIVEVSSDGTTFTPLSFTPLPTGSGTAIWNYRTASGTIPAAANLRIQFRQNGTVTQYRIDDVKLDQAMAVTLSSFTSESTGDNVMLRWRTESETNSYRWVIERSGNSAGPFVTQAEIAAAGNSSQPREYQWNDHTIIGGATYYYRLCQQDLAGGLDYFGPVSVAVPSMSSTASLRAYPNPFRHATSIRDQLQSAQQVDLRIYNAAGQLVRLIGNALGNRGDNTAEWDGHDLHGRAVVPGVYFYRLITGSATRQGLVVLIK